MIRSVVCAAIAAAFVAFSGPVPAQAGVPVAPMATPAAPSAGALSGPGAVQKVAWRQRCWTTRRVRWRHGRRVVVRVRHCAPRHHWRRHHRRHHCWHERVRVRHHHHWVWRTIRRCRWY